MKARKYPNKEYLDEIFRYDGDTGILYNRIIRNGHAQKNDPAGSLCKSTGYLELKINCERFKIHRIIWIILNGSIDRNMEIDHIDQDKTNNQIENLRLVTHAENLKNKQIYNSNTSGHAGVGWYKRYEKWVARIHVKGKRILLGYFEDIEDAIEVRKAAEIKYGYHKNHGGKK